MRKFRFQLVHKVCFKNLTGSRSKYAQVLQARCQHRYSQDSVDIQHEPYLHETFLWGASALNVIHPTMSSSHSSEGTCSRWMRGNAVEKSQKVTVTHVARPLCDMLYRIIESRQYITSWIYHPGRVPNWYPVSVLWVSVFLVSQEMRILSTSLAKALCRLSSKYTSKCSLCGVVPFLCLVFLCETCTVHRELKYEKIRASRGSSIATGLFLVKW